ncbi:MAG: phosphotransacetylase family protein [Chloroflexi bacterium]|nr:phosphotransacetylase family protein [Chloroflexota bacterium]
MISLYITSLRPAGGKTAFAAGLAKLFHDAGKKVGLLKPVVAGPELPGNGYVDPDAAFFQKAFSPEEPANAFNVIAPSDKLKEALQKVSSTLQGKKDVLIVEGINLAGPHQQLSIELARAVGARVIMVARYSKDTSVERVVQACAPLNGTLLGVIINAVPAARVSRAREDLAAPLEKAGLKVLSIVPEDRVLCSVSVADLAEGLKGKVLINQDRLDAIAENFMLGAMTLESGKTYFNRKPNKVAIIRGERPDMMLAALHTSTIGIIATGDVPPSDQAMLEAEVKKVPVVAVPRDTAAVAAEVEKVLAGARFRHEKKLERVTEILGRTLDFKALAKEMGLN